MIGFWLDLLIGLPLASCSWCDTQPLAILSSFRSNIYIAPHMGVTSGSSSKLGNNSPLCEPLSYGSYCDISSMPKSAKSSTEAWGPSLWWADSMNVLHFFALLTSPFISGVHTVHGHMKDLAILSQNLCCHGSILGSKYLPSLKWPSRYGDVSSWNITHLDHSNSQNWLVT